MIPNTPIQEDILLEEEEIREKKLVTQDDVVCQSVSVQIAA